MTTHKNFSAAEHHAREVAETKAWGDAVIAALEAKDSGDEEPLAAIHEVSFPPKQPLSAKGCRLSRKTVKELLDRIMSRPLFLDNYDLSNFIASISDFLRHP